VPDHGSPVTGGEGSRALDSRKRYLHDSVKDCSNRCTNFGASKLPLLRESSFSLVITVTTPSLTSVVEVTQAAKDAERVLTADARKVRRKGLWCAPTVYTSMCREFQNLSGQRVQAAG